MSVTIYLARSWDYSRTYKQLDEMERVLPQYLPPDYNLDWDYLYSLYTTSGRSYDIPYSDSSYFSSLLNQMCGGPASGARVLDIVPLPFTANYVDLSKPGLIWYMFPLQHIINKWQNFDSAFQERQRQLAPLYEPDLKEGSQHSEQDIADIKMAYCLMAIVELALLAQELILPIRVGW